MARATRLFFSSLILALTACAANSSDNQFGNGGSSGTNGSSGSAGIAGSAGTGGASGSSGFSGSAGIGATGGTGGGATGCEEGVGDHILVVSSENVLLKFYPGKNYTFEKVGDLTCPANGATPFSMAVDRTGKAWVLYNNGQIFHVITSPTAPPQCLGLNYQTGQQGWDTFGMGFVSDAVGGADETLFVIDAGGSFSDSQGLGKISASSLQLSTIGAFDGGLTTRSAEVTGRGDARLFGFFVDLNGGASPSIAEIDKTTAHIISNDVQTSVPPTINSWAFAHWGGSFYMFTGSSGNASRVDKFTPATATSPATTTQVVTSVVVDGQSQSIVGAGVSTCAPTEPPIQ